MTRESLVCVFGELIRCGLKDKDCLPPALRVPNTHLFAKYMRLHSYPITFSQHFSFSDILKIYFQSTALIFTFAITVIDKVHFVMHTAVVTPTI